MYLFFYLADYRYSKWESVATEPLARRPERGVDWGRNGAPWDDVVQGRAGLWGLS